MRASERKALATYLTDVSIAVMDDHLDADARNHLIGYSSAHLASLAGLLRVADGRDLSGSIDKDRELFSKYVERLKYLLNS